MKVNIKTLDACTVLSLQQNGLYWPRSTPTHLLISISLRHTDGNHTLVRWRMFHGCVGGEFQNQWNNHGLSTQGGKTPLQLWQRGNETGMHNQSMNGVCDIDSGFGIDDNRPLGCCSIHWHHHQRHNNGYTFEEDRHCGIDLFCRGIPKIILISHIEYKKETNPLNRYLGFESTFTSIETQFVYCSCAMQSKMRTRCQSFTFLLHVYILQLLILNVQTVTKNQWNHILLSFRLNYDWSEHDVLCWIININAASVESVRTEVRSIRRRHTLTHWKDTV